MPRVNVDYAKTVIYKIQHIEKEEMLYVGHTTDFTKRKYKHKCTCKTSKAKIYKMIRDNGGWDCFNMVVVEEFPCENSIQACKREDEVMRDLKSNMNSNHAINDIVGMFADLKKDNEKQYIMMTEFREFLEKGGIKESTIDIHIAKIDKFGEVTDHVKQMIKKIKEENTLSKQRTLAGSVSKYYQYKGWDNDPLLKLMNDINEKYTKELVKKNKEMNLDTTIPSVVELKERMKMLFETGEYRAYCIMYLMLTYHTRNMDMVADIVDDIKEINELDNWFVRRERSILWIRNKYKTAFSYGQKKHVITNPKFVEAIYNLGTSFIARDENLFTVIQKATGGVTEIQLTKIFMRDANNMNSVRKVAKNRGTSSALLVSNYNIT